MQRDNQANARNLAALEAAIAAELATSRTMTLAVASAPSPNELRSTVEAWLHDWTDYHTAQATNPILKAALPVAASQVSSLRVAAAVWHLHQTEWTQPHTTPLTPAPEAEPAAQARIRAVPPLGKFAPVEIEVDGKPVRVAACVNDVLWDIANGTRRLKFRPETYRKLRAVVPWLAGVLKRDHGAKVLSNRHTYDVPDEALNAVDGTSSGTTAHTA